MPDQRLFAEHQLTRILLSPPPNVSSTLQAYVRTPHHHVNDLFAWMLVPRGRRFRLELAPSDTQVVSLVVDVLHMVGGQGGMAMRREFLGKVTAVPGWRAQ